MERAESLLPNGNNIAHEAQYSFLECLKPFYLDICYNDISTVDGEPLVGLEIWKPWYYNNNNNNNSNNNNNIFIWRHISSPFKGATYIK